MLKCVKTGGEYAAPDCVSDSQISHIYIPDGRYPEAFRSLFRHQGAEILTDESVFMSGEHKGFADIIKKAFNPLLTVQNVLFFGLDRQIIFQAPYLYERCIEHEKAIDELVQEAPDSDFMERLLCYVVTKDLRFMNTLTEKSFDPTAFKLCAAFIDKPCEDTKQALIRTVSCDRHYNHVLDERSRNEADFKKRILDSIGDKQQKNVLFIHLESISQLIFNTNRHLMPFINEVFGKSLFFNRYYSSATSTLMAVSAVFHGNDFELDSFKGYDDVILNSCHSENIFKILRKNGYETKPFIYTAPVFSTEYLDAKIYDDGVSGDGRIFEYDKFLSSIDDFMERNKNGKFAAFIDYEPTHCGVNDSETAHIPIFEQKSKYAYIALDKAINHIWKSLHEKGLIDKTIVVFYGDHGDDKWTRCINNGFSHMIEPYLSSIHCPLAIYDSRIEAGCINSVVSGIDIKPTVLDMLAVDNPDDFPYSGINIFKKENDCVYSAALFANQSETEKIGSFNMAKLNGFCTVETKNKSFCVVDDSFCLIVGKDGMQLFNAYSDPFSYNNLLSFYELDENGYALLFKNYGAWRGHFRLEIMADAQIYDCLRGLYRLREKLIERIEVKCSLVRGLENPFDFGFFDKIRERAFIY